MSRRKLTGDRQLLLAEILQRMYVWDPPQSQTKIAADFNIEKSTVSRLIAQARDENLYSLKLNLPRIPALEAKLSKAYKIRVVVEPIFHTGDPKDLPIFTSLLAEAAARFLEGEDSPIQSGTNIGLGCGATLRELVNCLTPGKFHQMRFSQVTVEAMGEAIIDQSPFTLVGTLYGKWREDSDACAIHPLPGTLRDQDGNYTKAYERYRDKMMERFEELDVLLMGVGVGEIGSGGCFDFICKEAGITELDLKRRNAVGEVLNCPYDESGASLIDKLPRLGRVVDSVGLDALRQMVEKGKTVIAVAGGDHKTQALKVALDSRLVSHLVTDHETAKKLLDIKTQANNDARIHPPLNGGHPQS